MRKKIITIGVIMLAIVLAVFAAGRIKEAIEKKNLAETPINTVVVTWSGGFNTRANTHPVSVVFDGYNVYLKTVLDAYDGKEETELIEDVEVPQEKIDELYVCVQRNLWDIQNNLEEMKDLLDGGFSYITINGERYGGYAIMNDSFNEVKRMAYDLVGTETIEAFRQQIREWFGEEE